MASSAEEHNQKLYCISERDDCIRVQQRIQDLEISEARYQNLFEAVKDAILSFTPAGRVNRANSACLQILGWPTADLFDKQLADLFGAQSLAARAFERSLKGQVCSLEQDYEWPSGRQVTLALQISPIHDGQEISGVLLMARDLTEVRLRELERTQLYQGLQQSHKALEEKALALEESQRQLQEAMAEQEKVNAELRELGRLKSDFIGIASHELRTPLTFLLGALEFLQESLPAKINEDEKGLLGYAMQGGKRLSDIVDNMLDIVRLEAEGFRPQRQLTSIHPLLEQIRSELSWALKERQLRLEYAATDAWPEFLIDPVMIRRALEDVIENAIKYTPAGGLIRVAGRLRTQQSLQEELAQIRLFWPDFPVGFDWMGDYFEVSISDDGIGIPRQELAHVFERFYTAGSIEEHSSAGTLQGQGAGLGLALVKRIVRGHNGLAWVQSPGSQQETGLSQPGSCFRLLLPFERQVKKLPEQPRGDRKPRVLLIDDEPAIRRFVEVLMNKDYQLELAASGPEGLERAAQCQPDLILLDIYMQGMDGFEVCRKLKANPHTATIPVAMFTAISRKYEKEKGLAAGAVDYITKPFFPRELLQRVELLLKEHGVQIND